MNLGKLAYMRMLNQITSEEMEFFAVEIQLLKVDDSFPAPFFKVKASPNDPVQTVSI